MSDEMPHGWTKARLQDVVTKQKGKKPAILRDSAANGFIPYLDIYAIEKGIVREFAEAKSSKIAAKDDLFVVWDGARSGWVGGGVVGAIGSTIMALTPRIIESAYLRHYIASQFQTLNTNTRGTGIPHVDPNIFWELEVPLAPLGEQRRIVAKLEKLLSKVDACQKRLAKIPVLLKRFRQSVLAAACSGRLTADWREEKDVDDEWPTEPLSNLFAMRNGKSLTADKRKHGNISVYGGNGHMGTHCAGNADGLVIVIGRVGAQCGNVHFVSGKVWVTDNAISLEARHKLEPAFYTFFLRSQNLNQLSAGTGQPYVSQEILGPIETPVVSLAEQQEIVRRVEWLFALADQIEVRFAQARLQVGKLTPSLLARAFRGELVPQDPNDEPASELLERIGQQQNRTENAPTKRPESTHETPRLSKTHSRPTPPRNKKLPPTRPPLPPHRRIDEQTRNRRC